jgi:hypothetical protein
MESLLYLDPTDWAYPISPPIIELAQRDQRQQRTAWAQWNAYLNSLCLHSCLTYFQAETAISPPDPARTQRIWTYLNGSLITAGSTRIALIPTESVDRLTLEVPQEWVDLPSWAADYYLSIQFSPDYDAIEILGYTTHKYLQQQGERNDRHRLYNLPSHQLMPDLNLLWLTHKGYSRSQTQGALAPLPALSPQQTEMLMQRLDDPITALTRTDIPFRLWGALLDSPTWHHRSPITQLSKWLQAQIDGSWQAVEAILHPQQIITTRRSPDLAASSGIDRAKILTFSQGSIALIMGINAIEGGEFRIDLHIYPAGGQPQLPGTTRLRLLQSAVEMTQIQATATETIHLQFRARAQECFDVEITCDQETQWEAFEI